MEMEVIEDACIIIDTIQVDLIGVLPRLKISFITTDIIIREVDGFIPEDHRAYLQIVSLTAEELIEIQLLQVKYPSLSIQDCSALFLAKKSGYILLTNDKQLNGKAGLEGVDSHGELWLLDLILQKGLMKSTDVVTILKKLMELNPRLPVTLCEQKINEWVQQYP